MSAFKNQRGQAAVENILIIALGVAIILGGIYQLNSAFRVFADNYFGDYLGCLLETGELPTLGNTQDRSPCAADFKPFSLADGRPAVGRGVGEGGAGNEGPLPSDAKDTTGTARGGGNGEGSGNISGASGFPGSRTRVRGGGSGSGSGDDSASESENSSSGSAFAQGYSNNSGTRFPVRYPDGPGGKRRRLEDRPEARTKVTTQEIASRSARGRPQLIKVRMPTGQTVIEEEAATFTVGNLLRYILIIVIIIAIVIFIGGQALQVSKST